MHSGCARDNKLSRSLLKKRKQNMMPTNLTTMLIAIAALLVGAMIGYSFGLIQDAARRRNEKRQQAGTLKSGWSVMPGSGARVMYLVIILALIQLMCPLLFNGGVQWWVSGGRALGYGYTLFAQLRQKL